MSDEPSRRLGGEADLTEQAPADLPDPSKPTTKRGTWEQAALVNVAITELVKRQIKTVTRPQNR